MLQNPISRVNRSSRNYSTVYCVRKEENKRFGIINKIIINKSHNIHTNNDNYIDNYINVHTSGQYCSVYSKRVLICRFKCLSSL